MSNIWGETPILILKEDQFRLTCFNGCFRRPSNYSINNCFLKDSTFELKQKSNSGKMSDLKILYEQVKKRAYANAGYN